MPGQNWQNGTIFLKALSENPDVIIDLVDATNIERNLYLTTQLIETGVPVVIALNVADLILPKKA